MLRVHPKQWHKHLYLEPQYTHGAQYANNNKLVFQVKNTRYAD